MSVLFVDVSIVAKSHKVPAGLLKREGDIGNKKFCIIVLSPDSYINYW
jgi:hypothetical protein